MSESEIAAGVAGCSTTYFTYDDRVSDQNNHRHDQIQQDSVNVVDDKNLVSIETNEVDSLADQCGHCQTDDEFLRSGCCTPQCCLFTFTG